MKSILRISLFLLAFLVPVALSAGLGSLSTHKTLMSPASRPLPTPTLPFPSVDPTKPTVAILLGNDFTEVTDFLTPYALFSASDAFNVYSVAPTRHLTTLTGGLDVMPDFSLAEFDAQIGKAPDVIVIPAIPNIQSVENAPILAWIKQYATAHTIMLSWCVGSQTLALTGLLDGKKATTHWADITRMEQTYPNVRWERGLRYVNEGSLVTSAGLTSGIDATLHVLERLKGRELAQTVANRFHYPNFHFVDAPQVQQYTTEASDGIYVLNDTYNWTKTSLGVLLYDGVGEIELASIFDTYAGSLASQMSVVARTRQVVTTEYGLHLLPRFDFADLPAVSRLLVPGANALSLAADNAEAWKKDERAPLVYIHADAPTRFAFEAPLEDLARQENIPTATLAAKRLEYRTPVQLTGSGWPLHLLLRPLFIGLIGLGLALWIERWISVYRKHRQK